jgi:hypothetical protein
MRLKSAVVLASVVGCAIPLTVVTPSQASTTIAGCTVTPRQPFATGEKSPEGLPMVAYRIAVTCAGDRNIRVRQQIFEFDNGSPDDEDNKNDPLTPVIVRDRNFATGGTIFMRRDVAMPLKDKGDDRWQEAIHSVRFIVCSVHPAPNTICTEQTPWEFSAVRRIIV